MATGDYPADVRADYPPRSSRGWAVLTILLIKLIALIPHAIVLIFLGIAQWVVAFIAQFVVAFKGEYPAGMHEFVTGVLRWSTRVASFALSLTDKYPPFSLKPLDDYPVDIVVQRPSAAEPRVRGVHHRRPDPRPSSAWRCSPSGLIRNADTIASWGSDGRQLRLPVELPVVRRQRSAAAPARGHPALHRARLRRHRGVLHLVRRAVDHPLRGALPARPVRGDGGLHALDDARERLRARARRPLSAVHAEPVAHRAGARPAAGRSATVPAAPAAAPPASCRRAEARPEAPRTSTAAAGAAQP